MLSTTLLWKMLVLVGKILLQAFQQKSFTVLGTSMDQIAFQISSPFTPLEH
jgi:hypothetical protein